MAGSVDFSGNPRGLLLLIFIAIVLGVVAVDAQDVDEARARVTSLRAQLADLQGRHRSLDFEQSQLATRIEERKRAHGELFGLAGSHPSGDDGFLSKLKGLKEVEQPAVNSELERLQAEEEKLMTHFASLTDQMKSLQTAKTSIQAKLGESGVEHLVETYTQGFSPVLKGVVTKSWEDIGVPFFSLISRAADTNSRLVDHVSDQIDTHVHYNVKKSPFVSGLLFYCVILIPVLLTSIVMIQIIKTTAQLSASHYVLFNSSYLLLLSAGCGMISLVSHTEPLLLFQVRHGMAFVACMLFLSLLYIFNVLILAAQTTTSKNRHDTSQLLATVAIGGHFFWFVWRPTMLDRNIKMFSFAYCIYATILGFVVYERLERLAIPWRDNLIAKNAVRLIETSRAEAIRLFNSLMTRVGERRLRTKRLGRRSSRYKSRSSGYLS